MRLLTNHEMRTVSGGSHLGENDPLSLNGDEDNCAKISSSRKKDQCYLERARTQNCPDGWTARTDGISLSKDGVTVGSTTVVCNTSDSSDAGNDDGSDDDTAANCPPPKD